MKPRIDGAFDVVGSAQALTCFGTLDESTLSHGYLFFGPSGVGKKTFARHLAQSLFCRRSKTTLLGYDGTCAACTSFLAGSYPDYYESIGEIAIGDEGEEAIREERAHARGLVRELSLRPYSGRWRVALLGDVRFVSDWAAHALLRFLEEPPPDVVIILTTDAPGMLFDTIRSRLVEIPFPPLSGVDVVRLLRTEGVSAERARLAGSAAMGSVTRARSILEGQESGLREAALQWFEDVLAGKTPDVSFLDRASKAADKRRIAADVLEFVRVFARDWASLTMAGRDARLLASDMRRRIERLPRADAERVAAALEAIADTQRLASTNVTPALVLDYLRMELTPNESER